MAEHDTTISERPRVDSRGERMRLEAEQAAKDFRALLDIPPARRFLGRLMLSLGMLRVSFQPGDDALTAAMRDGARNAALDLFRQIDQERPGEAFKLITEARTTSQTTVERRES